MPIYEYKCLDCKHEFEKIVRLNETPVCEACGSSNVEKQFSLSGIRTSKSTRRSTAQEKMARGKIRRDRAHAESDFLKKELSEGH